MLGPFATTSRLTPIHQLSPLYCRTPPAHRCPQRQRRQRQRQRVTEGTAMAPWNGPKNVVSIHTASWCTKNRYVNICIYVDSLWLFAASSPTGVVAQLGVRWIALLRFLGLNPGEWIFFYFRSFLCFVLNLCFISQYFHLFRKKVSRTCSAVDHA